MKRSVSSRLLRGFPVDELDQSTPPLGTATSSGSVGMVSGGVPGAAGRDGDLSRSLEQKDVRPSLLTKPIAIHFNFSLKTLNISAALLPSLQASYQMQQVTSNGVTGHKASFVVDLPHHSLSFTSKLKDPDSKVPSAASISLPFVHVLANYIHEKDQPTPHNPSTSNDLGQFHEAPQGKGLKGFAKIGMCKNWKLWLFKMTSGDTIIHFPGREHDARSAAGTGAEGTHAASAGGLKMLSKLLFTLQLKIK
ncbi:unnamed protein product, partial [Cyprideis torosa]